MGYSLIDRDFIMSRLKIDKRTSYRLVGHTQSKLFKDTEIIAMLNSMRRNGALELSMIPDDLMTPEEVSAEYQIPERAVWNWTHRRRVRIPPYYRLTSVQRRFSRSQLEAWLDKTTKRFCA